MLWIPSTQLLKVNTLTQVKKMRTELAQEQNVGSLSGNKVFPPLSALLWNMYCTLQLCCFPLKLEKNLDYGDMCGRH